MSLPHGSDKQPSRSMFHSEDDEASIAVSLMALGEMKDSGSWPWHLCCALGECQSWHQWQHPQLAWASLTAQSPLPIRLHSAILPKAKVTDPLWRTFTDCIKFVFESTDCRRTVFCHAVSFCDVEYRSAMLIFFFFKGEGHPVDVLVFWKNE